MRKLLSIATHLSFLILFTPFFLLGTVFIFVIYKVIVKMTLLFVLSQILFFNWVNIIAIGGIALVYVDLFMISF